MVNQKYQYQTLLTEDLSISPQTQATIAPAIADITVKVQMSPSTPAVFIRFDVAYEIKSYEEATSRPMTKPVTNPEPTELMFDLIKT